MKYHEIEKGKFYYRKKYNPKGRKASHNPPLVYKMLVVDKNDKKKEILASSIPLKGTPTAPTWFPKSGWGDWVKEKPETEF